MPARSVNIKSIQTHVCVYVCVCVRARACVRACVCKCNILVLTKLL
jgi:hypothetical protein